ncbi:MAG: helix-turn-helix domain-containing protein [Actinomycetota bacterium]|nr:helix-turn-helix domain-containing protein [Actinomycetota bacterium]
MAPVAEPSPVAEVVMLRWPEERVRAKELADAGVAVLYLLKEETDPPTPRSCLEDWVRMPGDERDLRARLAALELRAAAHQRPPFVDELGRLHHDGTLLALSPVEARLAAVLIERFGEVVADTVLAEHAGDGRPPPSTSLRADVARLRSTLRAANLGLRRVRGRGYLLDRR